jgi:hypothetical protein
MWSLDYEEVPIDEAKSSTNHDEKTSNEEIDSDDASSTAELQRLFFRHFYSNIKRNF